MSVRYVENYRRLIPALSGEGDESIYWIWLGSEAKKAKIKEKRENLARDRYLAHSRTKYLMMTRQERGIIVFFEDFHLGST